MSAPAGGPPRFDLAADLPRGTSVLEASAGTGKTYTIAALAARYVAEEAVPLPQLLIVTFTRAAAAELRARVRARLVDAATVLDRALAGAPVHTASDQLAAALLADGARRAAAAELRARRQRLGVALADFDAATISTIHGFCQQVRQGVGLAGDLDRDHELVEDDADLLDAVIDDCFLTAYGERGQPPESRARLAAVAREAVRNPDARIVPDPATAETEAAATRAAFAQRVRDELARRKRALGLVGYDDVLTGLADALAGEHGRVARARLAARYRIALIDEFQDTDPTQWRIFRGLFDRRGTLVLIGDPKQAIYAFRGADVHTYLAAAEAADRLPPLLVNWRSDGRLLDALNVLLGGATLGDKRIAYRDVEPAPAHRSRRLHGAPVDAALRLRVVGRDAAVARTERGYLQAQPLRAHVAADLAADVVALLEAGARRAVDPPDADDGAAAEAELRPVVPRDVAVLVRTNAEAGTVQQALREAGVPAVINGVGSVFATPAATEWRWLLEALERPAAAGRVRTAALTALVGWTAADLASADDDAVDALTGRLIRWAQVLRERGVAALQRVIAREQQLPARLLGRVGGERHLIDLDHVAELLHAAMHEHGYGPAALAGWLRERLAEADADEAVPPDERARRLESDDEAVQVLTVHRAKGLQWPIVYCPYLWGAAQPREDVPVVHDGGERLVDVAGGGDEHAVHLDRAREEHSGEQLRLLYVALTRAMHQVVVWWAPAGNAQSSPLARMLWCRSGDGRPLSRVKRVSVPGDDAALQRLGHLAGRAADGAITVEPAPPKPLSARWQPDEPPPADLAAGDFDRPVDHRWRRHSYSRLIAAIDAEPGATEPEEREIDDEHDVVVDGAPPADPGGDDPRWHEPLPLGDLPGGREVGTAVHGLLEGVDFAADDLPGALHAVLAAGRHRAVDLGAPATLVDGLTRALTTPLGPELAEARLRDVGRGDRLDEVEFELPLARRGPAADLGDVAALLRARLPVDDPLVAAADRLDDPRLAGELRGYLTGSIDLLARLPTADGGGHRFVVVDYKTNRLGPREAPLTPSHYRPEALAEAMVDGDYVLQALLYAVAAHRYLRWRLPAYDPDRHLGGVAYLFVRGMTGHDVLRDERGRPCGVLTWQPPAALVTGASDLLDAGEAGS